jgi:mannose-1-phosphate guanylyltransferase/mannose-6-phosphate isomerase
MYVVILAGGGGTRLWPLSRRDRPKPFLPLLGPRTLFQQAVERAAGLLGTDGRPIGPGAVHVVAERRHLPLVREQAPGLPAANLLAEPEGRNTAAAIAFAALAIDRPHDEVMVVLPADHFIRDVATFIDTLSAAAATLAGGSFDVEDPLVTLGIRPTEPATGYGYLVPRTADSGPGSSSPGSTTGVTFTARLGGRAVAIEGHPLAAFEEKPSLERAGHLVRTPGVCWNAGMFLWRRRAILAALAAHAGDILAGVGDALAAGTGHSPQPAGPASADPLGAPEAAERYRAVRATSIDYAVMEPAGRAGGVVMGTMDVGWSDVGSWTAVRDAGAGDVVEGTGRSDGTGPGGAGTRHLDIDSRDVFVKSASGRLVVTLGLRDTIVVDTPDALLVCSADRVQDVRKVVERLAAAEENEYL